jgi:hypothetical protein
MGKLNEICNSIKEFDGYNFSDDMILDVSTRIFISQIIQEERKEAKKTEWKPKNADMPLKKATDKQKGMLSKLKIPYTENTSMIEASKLIEEKLGKK